MAQSAPCTNSKPTDARRSPPESIRSFYKTYQRISPIALTSEPAILDFSRGIAEQQDRLRVAGSVSHQDIRDACARFGSHEYDQFAMLNLDVAIYESVDVPGEPSNDSTSLLCIS